MSEHQRRLAQTISKQWVPIVLIGAFAWEAWRGKWISDDGYIYLTYVQNLTENGAGPVFNRGEYVEAFTSTGWFAALSLGNLLRPDRLLTMRQMTILISLCLSVAALALWPVVERQARRTLGRARDDIPLFLPMAAMAGTYVFQSFATSGLETPLQLLWLMAVVATVWTEYGSERHLWLVAGLGGVGPLVRPDLAIVSAALLLLFVRTAKRHHVRPRVWLALIAFALPTGAAAIARIVIYGQLLPNTYYAKTSTGIGFEQGWKYLADVVLAHHVWWVAIVAVGLVAAPLLDPTRRRATGERYERLLRANRRRAWLLATSATHGVYVLSAGGDFMHGRFWITSWTLLLGALAGLWLPREVDQTTARQALTSALVVSPLLVLLLCSTTESRQRLSNGDTTIIDGIADEASFYEQGDPNLHYWDGENLHFLADTGRRVRELAEVLDTEIGITRGAIGQVTYFAQRNHGKVFVLDQAGLTQQTGSRLTPAGPDPRIGHAKLAPELLLVLNPRVDLQTTSFPDFNDAFGFDFSGEQFVLINFDLIDPLVSAGIIADVDADRMRQFLRTALEAEVIDRNFLTLLDQRYHEQDDIRRRLDELHPAATQSIWATWLDDNAASLQLLDNSGCSTICLGHAFERHRAPAIPMPDLEPDIIGLE